MTVVTENNIFSNNALQIAAYVKEMAYSINSLSKSKRIVMLEKRTDQEVQEIAETATQLNILV